jgi:hypothetical protein
VKVRSGYVPERPVAGPGSSLRGAVERGVKSLFGRSKRLGRRTTQSESCSLFRFTTRSRAAHVTAKAPVRLTGLFRRCLGSGPLGLQRAARSQGLDRTTRGP